MAYSSQSAPKISTSSKEGGGRIYTLLPWFAALASLSFALLALVTAPIAMDEFEFYRATRWVAEGKVPYMDFWEHHFPLQWYIMAPFSRWASGATVASILTMREFQAIFWIGSALLIVFLLRRRKVHWNYIALAMAFLFSCRLFYRSLIEYRIDVPMNFFFLLGLVLLEERYSGNRRPWMSLLAGLALSAACLCSQRMIPLAIGTVLVYAVSLEDDRWGIRWDAWLAAAAGAVSGGLIILLYWANGGLTALMNQCVRENALYETLPQGTMLPNFWQKAFFVPLLFPDYPTFALYAFGLIIVGAALYHARKPDVRTRLALGLIVQVTFLGSISSPYVYQFQTMLWLLMAMVGLRLEGLRIGSPKLRQTGLAAFSVLVLAGAAFSGHRLNVKFASAIQDHQEHVVRLVHLITRPDEPVLDGSGYGFNRPPEFRYWFLPRLVRVLTKNGVLPPLTLQDILRKPPGALVVDSRLIIYLKDVVPHLVDFFAGNYLPLETCVWVPAPNTRLKGPGDSHQWEVLRSGNYRLVVSKKLASSPWFVSPLTFAELELLDSRLGIANPRRFELDVSTLHAPSPKDGLSVLLDGRPLALQSDGSCDLRAGGHLAISSESLDPMAVFLLPKPYPRFFLVPFPFIPLEPSIENQ